MTLTKRQQNALDKQVTEIFHRRCNRVQIDLLDISKIYRVGREALLAGRDAEAEIVAFVDTIRKN